jgi:hypothetical protein
MFFSNSQYIFKPVTAALQFIDSLHLMYTLAGIRTHHILFHSAGPKITFVRFAENIQITWKL